MPELPEVETIARTLKPKVINRVIEDVKLSRESTLHPNSASLLSTVGCKIIGVKRRGKLLILQLDGTDKKANMICIHLRMTGRLMVYDVNHKEGKHTRCQFFLKDEQNKKTCLFFDDIRTFGIIFVSLGDNLNTWKFWKELGQEPFDMEYNRLEILLSKQKRGLKTVLLDQTFIAGIGNIYADEILFQSRLKPDRPANSLNKDEILKLINAMHDVLSRAIKECGSSIRDYRDANGNAGAFQNSFFVYGRGGKQCKICGNILDKKKIAGRATVFCPNCQK